MSDEQYPPQDSALDKQPSPLISYAFPQRTIDSRLKRVEQTVQFRRRGQIAPILNVGKNKFRTVAATNLDRNGNIIFPATKTTTVTISQSVASSAAASPAPAPESGVTQIDHGGTGKVTQADAITALTGTQTSGYFLRSDGTNAALAAIQSGDLPLALTNGTTATSQSPGDGSTKLATTEYVDDAITASGGWSGSLSVLNKQIFTSSGTFTIPSGASSSTSFQFTITGGGGGGGTGTSSGGGGGAGAGGTARKLLSGLTAGNTITVTVGAAGAAGAASNAAPGGNGGNSSIASGTETISTVTANGGGGGNYGSSAAVGGPGGTTSGGDADSSDGGDGDSAVTGVAATGASGGASSWGGGGTGGRTGTGSNGRAFGSGGGAGAGNSVLGGTGAPGIVVVEWVL